MKTIFDKTTMKNLALKNRLFRSATWEALADNDGHFDEEIGGRQMITIVFIEED